MGIGLAISVYACHVLPLFGTGSAKNEAYVCVESASPEPAGPPPRTAPAELVVQGACSHCASLPELSVQCKCSRFASSDGLIGHNTCVILLLCIGGLCS
eukprot:scaffold112995_cov21-Tisochrysis_lutea.AAC.1